MRNILLVFTLLLLGFAASQGAARADCGRHQMLTDVAKIRAMEALPLTLKNVGNSQSNITWGDDSDHPRLTAALNLPLVGCAEDSEDPVEGGTVSPGYVGRRTNVSEFNRAARIHEIRRYCFAAGLFERLPRVNARSNV